MAKSYAEGDAEARKKIMHDAEVILMRDQPIAPLMSTANLWLVSDRVSGWQDNAANEHLSRFLRVAE